MAAARQYGMLAGVFGFIGIMLYPIVVAPMLNPDKWKQIQSETRKGVNQKDIQPGGMKVWSDPFGEQKKMTKEDVMPSVVAPEK